MVALEPGSGMGLRFIILLLRTSICLVFMKSMKRTAQPYCPAVCSLRCKSVRSRFPDEMTQWTRWELVALGLATVKRVTTTCKPFSNIVAK